ncbi:MAG TPA: hypothetical protein VFM46_12320 [Pseudomonadales bacterium]|nr:hypothetical protein [Pseudomonadales bacterium]
MNMQTISVTILGAGNIAELLTQQIKKRSDVSLNAVLASSETPTAGTQCVVYLPDPTEREDDTVGRILNLLKAGFNVVSTLPAAAFSNTALKAACKEGASTFHGSGGFQNCLAVRFNRAFASITRNISDIELIEELDVANLDEAEVAASAQKHFYAAGLHTLSEAVFGNANEHEKISVKGPLKREIDSTQRTNKTESAAQAVIQRNLGDHVIYDSIWTQRKSNIPLQYKLNTTSSDAIGHVTITFHQESEVNPVDHLICTGLLNAIRAASESAPGILHHDLEINHVKTDDRLAH